MSFLNQLKSQADALQSKNHAQQHNQAANIAQTEAACTTAWHYLADLVRQLNVIAPPGPALTLDGKTPWPAMKLVAFRFDSRKKMLLGKEVYDYLGMSWDIVPANGPVGTASVSANFPPGLERIQKSLSLGAVKHERKEVRHPEKNTLQAYRFDYQTQALGSVRITPDHDSATLAFRLTNPRTFELVSAVYAATAIQSDLLDEMAKLVLAQPSRFAP